MPVAFVHVDLSVRLFPIFYDEGCKWKEALTSNGAEVIKIYRGSY
jgi:hypothetical protein